MIFGDYLLVDNARLIVDQPIVVYIIQDRDVATTRHFTQL